MPRLKTKGEAMCIRLPVHIDDVFQREAAERGLTARVLAAEIIEEWIAKVNLRSPAHHADKAATHAASALANEFFS